MSDRGLIKERHNRETLKEKKEEKRGKKKKSFPMILARATEKDTYM